ncbi:EF-hand domain-containing protein [Stieleria marina]|uniref:EF-hand domain-containing protein n=1 Tax=Stieleria marina TaxID=1930275 RepID=A0A517P0H6_9BACT|nr:hypothetical protein K239x_48900 [Planctomycetes bacterium K23_9]
MNRVLSFSVVGILLCSNLLFAQPPGRGGPPGMRAGGPSTEMVLQLFIQADANSDGSVTKAELTTLLQDQGLSNQRGPGGPPPQRGSFGERGQQGKQQPPDGEQGGHHGPPPQAGQVLPEPIAQSLNLSEKQRRMLVALQADVDKRIAAILKDEQQEQLQNTRPPHGPGHAEGGDVGNRGQGRPQRPQRPQ